MNYFVADYLARFEDKGEWEKAEEIGENIRLQIHSLINSGIADKELWNEMKEEDEVKNGKQNGSLSGKLG